MSAFPQHDDRMQTESAKDNDAPRICFERLKAAGVEARADFYEGGFHGFNALGANKSIGKRCHENLCVAFRYAAEHYFKSQGN